MFNYTDDDGNFIVESGSAVPIMKVSGSVIYISGSILPFEASSIAFSEIGSLDKPFKELYVESASINFVDTSKAIDHADRRVKFSKVDVDNLKSGRPIHPDGHLSASGDLYVSGSTALIGRTDILGETRIDGLTDVRGGFRINGQAITDAELQALRGLSTGAGSIQTQLDAKHATINAGNRLNANLIGGGNVSSIEFNQLNGIGSSTIATQLAAKQDTITFGISNTNVIKCGDGIADNDFLKVDGTTLEGRSASEVKSDLSLVKGDVGLGNVDNTSDANKPVSTATQTALDDKATIDSVAGVLLPDSNNARDLGSSAKQWRHLYIDSNAFIDNVIAENSLRIDGTLAYHNVQAITPSGNTYVIDARAHGLFIIAANGVNVYGITPPGGRTGEIVRIICLRGVTFHHEENNIGVTASSRFDLPRDRDFATTFNNPTVITFMYVRELERWIRAF